MARLLNMVLLLMGSLATGGPAPQDDQAPSVLFKLYTRAHPSTHLHLDESLANVGDTDLDLGRPTVVLVHGFTESHDSVTVRAIRDAYLYASDLNVVVQDWRWLARGPHYEEAARNARGAGHALGVLLGNLLNATRDLHVVGFSLGAQVIGLATQHITSGRLPRVTALDPAKPIFEIKEAEERLDAGDAEFVQVIHTAGGFLSFLQPLGHADFYPNGGKNPQPSCSGEEAMICSHQLACMYFAESIARPMGFPATQCDSWSGFKKGRCDGKPRAFMGAFTPSSTRGQFYLRTNPKQPYGQGVSNKTRQESTERASNCSTVGHANSVQCAHFNDSDNSTADTVRRDPSALTTFLIVALVICFFSIVVFISFRYRQSIHGYCARTHSFK